MQSCWLIPWKLGTLVTGDFVHKRLHAVCHRAQVKRGLGKAQREKMGEKKECELEVRETGKRVETESRPGNEVRPRKGEVTKRMGRSWVIYFFLFGQL